MTIVYYSPDRFTRCFHFAWPHSEEFGSYAEGEQWLVERGYTRTESNILFEIWKKGN